MTEMAREEAAASGITPLEFLLNAMRDEAREFDTRLDAAKAAAPYVHARLSTVDVGNKGDSPFVVELVRFSQD